MSGGVDQWSDDEDVNPAARKRVRTKKQSLFMSELDNVFQFGPTTEAGMAALTSAIKLFDPKTEDINDSTDRCKGSVFHAALILSIFHHQPLLLKHLLDNWSDLSVLPNINARDADETSRHYGKTVFYLACHAAERKKSRLLSLILRDYELLPEPANMNAAPWFAADHGNGISVAWMLGYLISTSKNNPLKKGVVKFLNQHWTSFSPAVDLSMKPTKEGHANFQSNVLTWIEKIDTAGQFFFPGVIKHLVLDADARPAEYTHSTLGFIPALNLFQEFRLLDIESTPDDMVVLIVNAILDWRSSEKMLQSGALLVILDMLFKHLMAIGYMDSALDLLSSSISLFNEDCLSLYLGLLYELLEKNYNDRSSGEKRARTLLQALSYAVYGFILSVKNADYQKLFKKYSLYVVLLLAKRDRYTALTGRVNEAFNAFFSCQERLLLSCETIKQKADTLFRNLHAFVPSLVRICPEAASDKFKVIQMPAFEEPDVIFVPNEAVNMSRFFSKVFITDTMPRARVYLAGYMLSCIDRADLNAIVSPFRETLLARLARRADSEKDDDYLKCLEYVLSRSLSVIQIDLNKGLEWPDITSLDDSVNSSSLMAIAADLALGGNSLVLDYILLNWDAFPSKPDVNALITKQRFSIGSASVLYIACQLAEKGKPALINKIIETWFGLPIPPDIFYSPLNFEGLFSCCSSLEYACILSKKGLDDFLQHLIIHWFDMNTDVYTQALSIAIVDINDLLQVFIQFNEIKSMLLQDATCFDTATKRLTDILLSLQGSEDDVIKRNRKIITLSLVLSIAQSDRKDFKVLICSLISKDIIVAEFLIFATNLDDVIAGAKSIGQIKQVMQSAAICYCHAYFTEGADAAKSAFEEKLRLLYHKFLQEKRAVIPVDYDASFKGLLGKYMVRIQLQGTAITHSTLLAEALCSEPAVMHPPVARNSIVVGASAATAPIEARAPSVTRDA